MPPSPVHPDPHGTGTQGQAARIALPTERGVPPRCLPILPTAKRDAGSAPSCPPAAPESRCSWLRQPSHQRQPLHREAGGRELFLQRPAGRSLRAPSSGDAYRRGWEMQGLLHRHGTGLDPLLAHLQGFSSSLKPRPPRRRTGGEWELTHPAAAPERNLQGLPITSKAASSKSKGNRAGKASPQIPSGKPSHRPRRTHPSLPHAPPSNRSRGAGILRERMETGAGPTPLANPGAKPCLCQRRTGPKPHVPKPVAAGPNPSMAEEAPALRWSE